MAQIPQYTATPNVGTVAISTANTNLDGTGTIDTVFTAGASGSRVDAINIKAQSTTTAGMVRLFIDDGLTSYLVAEIPVIAITPSSSQPSFEVHLSQENSDILPASMASGYTLKASTENAETFNIIAQGGDY